MFTYTKRELRLLALSLTLFILLIYNLVLFPLINSIFHKQSPPIYSDYVYSKIIPLNQTSEFPLILQNNYEQSKSMENTVEVAKTKETTSEQKENTATANESTTNNTRKTQNSIIEENKNIKWRIQIPKINLDVHIMEGTTSAILLKAVGHFSDTSKWQGNVGLAAHNRGYQCNFFAKIKNLKIGDEIIYTTTNGKKVYKIQTNKVIRDTDWSYLEPTNDNRITLITCEENREDYRRCIQAIEIANYKI